MTEHFDASDRFEIYADTSVQSPLAEVILVIIVIAFVLFNTVLYLFDGFGFLPNNRFTAATARSILGPMNQATRGVSVNVKNHLLKQANFRYVHLCACEPLKIWCGQMCE